MRRVQTQSAGVGFLDVELVKGMYRGRRQGVNGQARVLKE